MKFPSCTAPEATGLRKRLDFITQVIEGTREIRIPASKIEGWFGAMIERAQFLQSCMPEISNSMMPFFCNIDR
mgnify:CR=1 FL=1